MMRGAVLGSLRRDGGGDDEFAADERKAFEVFVMIDDEAAAAVEMNAGVAVIEKVSGAVPKLSDSLKFDDGNAT